MEQQPAALTPAPAQASPDAMHPYQIFAKNFIHQTPFCGLFLDCGLGKALMDWTKVATPDGWQDIGKILPGDTVFDMDGRPAKVTAVFRHTQKQGYRVTLADGRSFICCDEHLIPYFKDGSEQLLVEPLKDLLPEYKNTPCRLPVAGPVKYPGRSHTILPTVAGAKLRKALSLTRYDDIFISNEYLLDSIENRLSLLAGFLGFDPGSDDYTAQTYTAIAKGPAAHQLKQLAWSLGWAVKTDPGTDELTFLPVPPDGMTNIVSIVKDAPYPMTCLTVDSPTHTFLIDDFVVSHNTRIVLEALKELNPGQHVLVIAPKTIARCTWQDEIEKWRLPIRTKSLVVNSRDKDLTKKARLKLYNEIPTAMPSVYFINRDLFGDLVKYFCDKKPALWYFPTIIIDEAQGFKSHSSQRFKHMKRIRPALSRVVELTGTPIPKGLMDLWALIYILDGGQRLGRTITEYRERWFYPTVYTNGYPVDWAPRPGAQQEIYARISDIVISMANTNLKLPDLVVNEINVKLSPDEKKRYKDFARTSVLDLSDGGVITAANAAVLQAKLSQMASGAIYTDPKTKAFERIHDKKLDVLEHIVATTGSPVLVAFWYNSDAKMIMERIPDAKLFDGTQSMMKRWNEGGIPVMLLQPASAGYGINLQFGGHTLVWYTIPWSLECHDQTYKRLYRQGQTQPVIMHYLLTEGTIDRKILGSIRAKHMTEQDLIDAVRVCIEEINEESPDKRA